MFALFLIRRNPNTDYRLLVAAAYLGLGCTWHSGLSGSATLLVNTPDNFLIKGKYLAGTIPTTETIFAPFNIILVLISIVGITVLMCLMIRGPKTPTR
jgi:short-chain fatty acids transporter